MYINGIEVLRYTDNASPISTAGARSEAYTRMSGLLRVYGASFQGKYYTYSGDAV